MNRATSSDNINYCSSWQALKIQASTYMSCNNINEYKFKVKNSDNCRQLDPVGTESRYFSTCLRQVSNPGRSGDKREIYPCAIQAPCCYVYPIIEKPARQSWFKASRTLGCLRCLNDDPWLTINSFMEKLLPKYVYEEGIYLCGENDSVV